MIACFLSNISAKYYKNPSMLSRVIAKNVGDVFFETRCIYHSRGARLLYASGAANGHRRHENRTPTVLSVQKVFSHSITSLMQMQAQAWI